MTQKAIAGVVYFLPAVLHKELSQRGGVSRNEPGSGFIAHRLCQVGGAGHVREHEAAGASWRGGGHIALQHAMRRSRAAVVIPAVKGLICGAIGPQRGRIR